MTNCENCLQKQNFIATIKIQEEVIKSQEEEIKSMQEKIDSFQRRLTELETAYTPDYH